MCGYGGRILAPLPTLHTLLEPRHRLPLGRDPGRAVLASQIVYVLVVDPTPALQHEYPLLRQALVL